MTDIGSLNETELGELTMREFGTIRTVDFDALHRRGIYSILGRSLDNIARLFTVLMVEEPEDWKSDLRNMSIRELIRDHSDEIDALLLQEL